MAESRAGAAVGMRRGVVAFTSVVLVLGCCLLVFRGEGGGVSEGRHAVSLLSFTIPFKTPEEAKAIEELYSPQPSSALTQPTTFFSGPPALSALPPAIAEASTGASPTIASVDTTSLSALPPAIAETSSTGASDAGSPRTAAYAQISGELKPVSNQQHAREVAGTPSSAQLASATAPPALLTLPSRSLVRRADSDVKKLVVQNMDYRSKIAQLKKEVAKLSASKQAEAQAIPVSNAKLVVQRGGEGGGASSSSSTSSAGGGALGMQRTIARDEASITTLTSEIKRLKLIDDGQYGILYRHLEHVDAKLKNMQERGRESLEQTGGGGGGGGGGEGERALRQKAVLQELPALPIHRNPLEGGHVDSSARAQPAAHGQGQSTFKFSQLDLNPERLLAGYHLAGGRNPGQDLEAARARYLGEGEREKREAAAGPLSGERTKISEKLRRMAQGEEGGAEEGAGGGKAVEETDSNGGEEREEREGGGGEEGRMEGGARRDQREGEERGGDSRGGKDDREKRFEREGREEAGKYETARRAGGGQESRRQDDRGREGRGDEDRRGEREGEREGESGERGGERDGERDGERGEGERGEREEGERESPPWRREESRDSARAARDPAQRHGGTGTWGNLKSRAAEGFRKAAAAASGQPGPYSAAMSGKVFEHFIRTESKEGGGVQAGARREEARREEERKHWQQERLQAAERGAWDDGPNRRR